MLLSIIIPVYNTKDYLPRCLDSVLKQQISDMEIICIDDGSTDGSGELLDQYAVLDSRIQVIHKKNAGLVQARKTGLQKARGKYTGYVDSDDWIEPEMYGVLCHIAEQYEADLVCSGYVWEKSTVSNRYDAFPEGLYQGKGLNKMRDQIFFCKSKDYGIRPSLCTKLFLSSILKKVQLSIPDEVSNCEDRLCTLAYMLEAKSVYILKRAFYHYVFRGESMSHHENPYYLDDIGKVYRAFRAMYQHPDFSEELRIQCQLYITKMVIEGLNGYMGFSIPDLMWIDPEWMERFPEKSGILLYGAGRLGKAYYRQITSGYRDRLNLAGWIDKNYQNLTEYPCRIEAPEAITRIEYDYVLLALVDKEPAESVRKYLMSEFGVDGRKIVWLEQRDIFWKYAEAAGLLKR